MGEHRPQQPMILSFSEMEGADRSFRIAIEQIIASFAKHGLDDDRIVSALNDALSTEVFIRDGQKAFERTY